MLVSSGAAWSSDAGTSADGLSAAPVSVPVSTDVSVSVSGSSSATGAVCAGDASALGRGVLLAGAVGAGADGCAVMVGAASASGWLVSSSRST